MPLGSIEEWRARIGSSWCALGRPFKTRSPFRGGAGRLQIQLTLNQVVTMMIILIMFVAMNLALRIVWTTGHCHTYSGFVASWLFHNLEISCSHLYQSLQHNTLPWLPVLWIQEWQSKQQKSSERRNNLLLVCVLVALLETEQSTIMASFVIFYQLLKSGDVELNPGPDIDYNSVDSSQILAEDDLFEVVDEISTLESRYYQIGVGLRLTPKDLQSIEERFPQDPSRALNKVVETWLQQQYNVQKFGPPTWQMLVKAVDSHAGGNDHMLAEKIMSKHPADVLSINNIREELDETWNYRARWRFIGIELGIDTGTLDAIAEDNRKVEDCLREMIKVWLKRASPKPTRRAMKAALQSVRVVSAAVCDGNTSPETNKLVEYTAYLKSLYKAKSQSCYLGDDHWPPPVTNKVFQLAMIKAEEVKRMNIEDDFVRHTITGKVDDILKRKVPIELKDIFANAEDQHRKVLIEGAPGSGKSTLSLHICHEWTKGNLFKEYSHVILVQLRELIVQNAIGIADLLPRRDDTMGRSLEKEINNCNGKGVLLIFDGWDELPTDAPGYEIIKNILNSKTLHESSIIITSRPISSTCLQQIVNSRIEILGFTKDELRSYFCGCLNGNMKNVKILQQRISENPMVAGSCYLPLNASILVHIFKCDKNILLSTQYGIFYELVISCVYRHLKKTQQDIDDSKLKSLEELPPSVQAQFQQLCKIAYDGVMNDRIIFDLDPGFNTLGLLQGVESFAIRGKSHSYNFLHLSIQELLAAVYMATQLKEDQQIEQFKKLFGRARFSAVFQFYAAKTKLQTPGIGEIVVEVVEKCIHDRYTTEFSGDYDPATDASYNLGHEPQPLLLLLLHCLFEAQDKNLCQLVATGLEGKLNLGQMDLNPADCLSVGYFLTQSGQFQAFLGGCAIDDSSCKALFRKDQIYDLQILVLRGNSIGAEGAKALSDAMKTMTYLQRIDLRGNPIGAEGTMFISDAIKTMTYFQELDLRGSSIGNDGAKAISDAMKTMTNLRRLDLSGNSIDDVGAKTISGAMKMMTTLQVLRLSSNFIGDKGAEDISVAMKTMINLRQLELDDNSIGVVGRKILQEAAKERGTNITFN